MGTISDLARWFRDKGTHTKPALLGLSVLIALLVADDLRRTVGGQEPPPAAPPVELSPYMGELQRLTHKLSLAVANKNDPLAGFYLYECLESLNKIKEEVPEYRGMPVALLIDQLCTPRFEELKQALEHNSGDAAANPAQPTPAATALAAVILSCNQCHIATQHGFIKITEQSGVNPFNQDFKP